MRIESLVSEGKIQKISELNHIALVLENNRLFVNSDHRFMKGQEQNGLLRCMKVTQDGKMKLIYMTDGLRPLSAIYGCMNFSAFMSVLENIFSTIEGVKDNGFLKPENIEDSLEYIFVEPKTMEVKLIYLPIQTDESGADADLMNFRNEMIRLIHSTPPFTGSDVQQVCALLEDETLSPEDVRREIQNTRIAYGARPKIYDEDDPVHGTKQLAANIRLISKDPTAPQSFVIHKSEFILGKSGERADGVIPKSTVSRIHCAILFVNEAYYVEDLDSTNGTKLNNERIPSRQRRRLMNGDLLNIAGSEYLVEY